MRPVDKMRAPVPGAFTHHSAARGELLQRLGRYCSYCERPTQYKVDVEHIQPQHHNPPAVADTWANYLLSCPNCNSVKRATNITPADVLLPDRDNTAKGFQLNGDGSLSANPSLTGLQLAQAQATVALFRMDERVRDLRDLNGNLVLDDRIKDRNDAFQQAILAKATWDENPSRKQLKSILRSALNAGFFSMWMKAFENDIEVRKRLLRVFKGTARDCFDPVTTLPIANTRTPVPGLVNSGKL